PTAPAWLAAGQMSGPPTAAEVHGESRPDEPTEADLAAPIEEPSGPPRTPAPTAARRKEAALAHRAGAPDRATRSRPEAVGQAAATVPPTAAPGLLAAAVLVPLALGGLGLASWRLTRLRSVALAALRRRPYR